MRCGAVGAVLGSAMRWLLPGIFFWDVAANSLSTQTTSEEHLVPSLVSLFPRGEGNVDCYFGPILFAVPGTSTLLAFTEARLFSCNDAGPKRIAMRKSEDHGLTWGTMSFIWNDTALPTLASKEARWEQWNKMGATNCK